MAAAHGVPGQREARHAAEHGGHGARATGLLPTAPLVWAAVSLALLEGAGQRDGRTEREGGGVFGTGAQTGGSGPTHTALCE